jgi:CRISPR-associated endonuclease/helicase Cas3
MLPAGFRHEMLSTQILEFKAKDLINELVDRDLLLHLIAAHHGHARPFAPVVIDDATDPSHRLDSGVAERFWTLTREHGWWGLAWLESILRLADQQASAAEQEGMCDE